MDGITWLKNELGAIKAAVTGLFMPSPSAALETRPMVPFHDRLTRQQIYVSGDALSETRGEPIYTSPSMDTQGLTIQNCFVGLRVRRDTLPQPAGWSLLFTAVLEGSCGSTWVELDSAQLNSNGLRRDFPMPLLGDDTLSMAIRFRLYAADNSEAEAPAVPRQIDVDIDGMLVAGVGF